MPEPDEAVVLPQMPDKSTNKMLGALMRLRSMGGLRPVDSPDDREEVQAALGAIQEVAREYARIAVLAERERCARICDQERQTFFEGASRSREEGEFGEAQWAEWNAQGANACAAAIRSSSS